MQYININMYVILITHVNEFIYDTNVSYLKSYTKTLKFGSVFNSDGT